MIECWVLVRGGKVGTFTYPTEAAARRVMSKGHTVVRMTDADTSAADWLEIGANVHREMMREAEAKAKHEDAQLERRRGL